MRPLPARSATPRGRASRPGSRSARACRHPSAWRFHPDRSQRRGLAPCQCLSLHRPLRRRPSSPRPADQGAARPWARPRRQCPDRRQQRPSGAASARRDARFRRKPSAPEPRPQRRRLRVGAPWVRPYRKMVTRWAGPGTVAPMWLRLLALVLTMGAMAGAAAPASAAVDSCDKYASLTGNDGSGDGSQAHPWRTVDEAPRQPQRGRGGLSHRVRDCSRRTSIWRAAAGRTSCTRDAAQRLKPPRRCRRSGAGSGIRRNVSVVMASPWLGQARRRRATRASACPSTAIASTLIGNDITRDTQPAGALRVRRRRRARQQPHPRLLQRARAAPTHRRPRQSQRHLRE